MLPGSRTRKSQLLIWYNLLTFLWGRRNFLRIIYSLFFMRTSTFSSFEMLQKIDFVELGKNSFHCFGDYPRSREPTGWSPLVFWHFENCVTLYIVSTFSFIWTSHQK
jgi:hypothetical protein